MTGVENNWHAWRIKTLSLLGINLCKCGVRIIITVPI